MTAVLPGSPVTKPRHRRRPVPRLGVLALLLCFSHTVGSETVYKWRDENGTIHYGSRPRPGQPAEKMRLPGLITTKPGISSEDIAIDRQNRKEAEREKRQQAAERPDAPPPLSARERKRRCAQARQRLANINARGRMRERNANGDYVYLSEPQRQQRRRQASQAVRRFCR